ncbi:integrase core domain-containing protein, partial [Burkholderia sp. RS02]|uniref:integrase core domain-containing protein n=1 Tax=Burkholderia sp. RS02 TaxID=3139775 RepID=UPI0032188267
MGNSAANRIRNPFNQCPGHQNAALFNSLLDHVQRFATDWMWTYNQDRPNMALGGFTPKQRLAMAA